jgi:hypothetical protein
VVVTAEDILNADHDIDLYIPDQDDDGFAEETMTFDPNFCIFIPTDASYATEKLSRRSDLGVIVRINGGPADWAALRMVGIAGSSFSAECVGMSLGTKRSISIINILRFMGINPGPVAQCCDSTSAAQVARNPHDLGASRNLGIKAHTTRCAIAHQDLQLVYEISGDMEADFLTKRMPRTQLARLSVTFFNNLRADCWALNPDFLRPLRDEVWCLDIDIPTGDSEKPTAPKRKVKTNAWIAPTEAPGLSQEDWDDMESEEEEDGGGSDLHLNLILPRCDSDDSNGSMPSLVAVSSDDDSASDSDTSDSDGEIVVPGPSSSILTDSTAVARTRILGRVRTVDASDKHISGEPWEPQMEPPSQIQVSRNSSWQTERDCVLRELNSTGHVQTVLSAPPPTHEMAMAEGSSCTDDTKAPVCHRMDLDVADMDHFLQQERLQRGSDIDASTLGQSLRALEGTVMGPDAIGFGPLIRLARGASSAAGSEFDVDANAINTDVGTTPDGHAHLAVNLQLRIFITGKIF